MLVAPPISCSRRAPMSFAFVFALLPTTQWQSAWSSRGFTMAPHSPWPQPFSWPYLVAGGARLEPESRPRCPWPQTKVFPVTPRRDWSV